MLTTKTSTEPATVDYLRSEVARLSGRLAAIEEKHLTSLGRFTHDLRGHLSVIVGFTGILQLGNVGALTEEQGRLLEYIKQESSSMLKLMDRMISRENSS